MFTLWLACVLAAVGVFAYGVRRQGGPLRHQLVALAAGAAVIVGNMVLLAMPR